VDATAKKVAPVHLVGARDPHVRLVHERRRIESVIGTLGTHPCVRHPAEALVHLWQEIVQRVAIAVAPAPKQLRQLARIPFAIHRR
jgi:hypothetical protein